MTTEETKPQTRKPRVAKPKADKPKVDAPKAAAPKADKPKVTKPKPAKRPSGPVAEPQKGTKGLYTLAPEPAKTPTQTDSDA